jgi:NAD(P)-dependent dehydrogenase (short-subunit alcohol dehydrogenase family)
MILEGKSVVVCGVGLGLGGEVARLCVRDGARVMLAARTDSVVATLAGDIDPSGARVGWHRTDITDAAQCAALVAATVERFGAIDALVQVAAVDALFGSFTQVRPEDWRKAIEVNVIGTTQVAQAVVPAMRTRGGGAIVLIGSQSSFYPITPQIAYAASKGALHSAMFFMAQELGQYRIRVNTVVPTWMWGPPVETYVRMLATQRQISADEVIGEITESMCIKEIPADEDVAEAVVFLCSERARMITGQTLMVNAGQVMT